MLAVLARARGGNRNSAHHFPRERGRLPGGPHCIAAGVFIRDEALATYKRLGLSVGALTPKEDAASALSGSASDQR